jgi:hypothetical protein
VAGGSGWAIEGKPGSQWASEEVGKNPESDGSACSHLHSFMQHYISDHLLGLVVRVPGYRSRGPRLRFQALPDFLRNSGSKTGPLSLVRIIEELLAWKSSGSGLENRY